MRKTPVILACQRLGTIFQKVTFYFEILKCKGGGCSNFTPSRTTMNASTDYVETVPERIASM